MKKTWKIPQKISSPVPPKTYVRIPVQACDKNGTFQGVDRGVLMPRGMDART
jgi:hypothetical protein